MKNELIRSAKSVNRHLTDDYLNNLSTRQLLNFCHPLDRKDFIDKINGNQNDND